MAPVGIEGKEGQMREWLYGLHIELDGALNGRHSYRIPVVLARQRKCFLTMDALRMTPDESFQKWMSEQNGNYVEPQVVCSDGKVRSASWARKYERFVLDTLGRWIHQWEREDRGIGRIPDMAI